MHPVPRYRFTVEAGTGTQPLPDEQDHGHDLGTDRQHPAHTAAATACRKIGLTALRTYLLVAMILVVVRVVQLALGH